MVATDFLLLLFYFSGYCLFWFVVFRYFVFRSLYQTKQVNQLSPIEIHHLNSCNILSQNTTFWLIKYINTLYTKYLVFAVDNHSLYASILLCEKKGRAQRKKWYTTIINSILHLYLYLAQSICIVIANFRYIRSIQSSLS